MPSCSLSAAGPNFGSGPIARRLKELTSLLNMLKNNFLHVSSPPKPCLLSKLSQHGLNGEAAVAPGRKTTDIITATPAPLVLPPRHLQLPHLDIPPRNTVWPTTQGFPTPATQALRRRRKRPRQSQQLLSPDRDVPRHVRRPGAILQTTVRNPTSTFTSFPRNLIHSCDSNCNC